MPQWIKTYTDPADADLAFAGIRDLGEMSGFLRTRDGMVTCDLQLAMRFDDVERLDADLAALIRKGGEMERGPLGKARPSDETISTGARSG